MEDKLKKYIDDGYDIVLISNNKYYLKREVGYRLVRINKELATIAIKMFAAKKEENE